MSIWNVANAIPLAIILTTIIVVAPLFLSLHFRRNITRH